MIYTLNTALGIAFKGICRRKASENYKNATNLI